ncbi:MAG: sigma-70 family RNA polymerase sigma factor [Lachnospiraceae bacterium]|nr:sigma-70 family RNA polymerase sigma factor [Lachnospiraceae bacterium]
MKDRKERFNEIYERYKDAMYRCAYSILNNESDALDAVQNAFIRLYEHMDTVMKADEKDGKEEAYVMTITRNAARDLYVKNKASVSLFYNMLEDKDFLRKSLGGSSAGSRAERMKEVALQECLREVNDDYNHIISLYYYQGYSLKEIAELYEITEQSATVRLHRARKAVERVLKKLGYYEQLKREWKDRDEK